MMEERIIESLASGVIAFNGDLRLITANCAAAENLGVQRESLPAGAPIDTLPLPGEFRVFVKQAVQGRRPLERQEVVLRTPDGARKEIGLSASLLQGPGEFNGMVFLFVDMTERRALERAAELNRQLAQIGGLTAGVVHELRNPLSVISGLAELVQRKTDQSDPRRKSVQAILDEARWMERSISQFLGFARPFEIEPTVCAPSSIAERALALCRAQAANKNVTIELNPGPSTPEIHADCDKLAQAINNIVSNAIDAVEPGGRVEVNVCTEDNEVFFDIRDNGPGIRVGENEDIFSPFFTKKESGTGLGLAICHRIVTAHNGSVSYKNREEGGAHFTVRVPMRTVM